MRRKYQISISFLQYFDQDRGAEMLKKVLVGDVDGDLVAKYTVLSGAYCLMRYIENCSGSSIAPHSMRSIITRSTLFLYAAADIITRSYNCLQSGVWQRDFHENEH